MHGCDSSHCRLARAGTQAADEAACGQRLRLQALLRLSQATRHCQPRCREQRNVGKHRWVVERTHGWFAGFGKLSIRCDQKKHCLQCRYQGVNLFLETKRHRYPVPRETTVPSQRTGLLGRPSRLQRNRWFLCPNVGAWRMVRSDCPVPRNAGFCCHLGGEKPPQMPAS